MFIDIAAGIYQPLFFIMSRYHSYINAALHIVGAYRGEMPFARYIKHFFAGEKKYGSRDRKQITTLCYSYFRAGHALKKEATANNILTAFFLCSNEPSPLIENIQPGWTQLVNLSTEEKLRSCRLPLNDIFPFADELSNGIDKKLFSLSLLTQPDLFIRIRPSHKKNVLGLIQKNNIPHVLLNNSNTVQLPAGTDIEKFLIPDREVVIQDYNSQQVLNFLSGNPAVIHSTEMTAWDCCAASGGKSILLYDLLDGEINLTVSDIRQSILNNLKQRFAAAGIKKFKHFIADMGDESRNQSSESYDIIICDAPCTGSGTWSRTPEQLYFFDAASIDKYAAAQKKIAGNAVQYLKPGGLFFYITCSVFARENEAIADYICKQPGMQLLKMENLEGYSKKADSMFVAVFSK